MRQVGLLIISHLRRDDLTSLHQRLKITLNLPPIEPRPPVSPRIYQRIYKYLDKILPAASLAGRARNNAPGMPGSRGLSSPASRPLPSRGTPTRNASLSQFRTPSRSGTPSKLKTREALQVSDTLLPAWMRPVVRHLHDALSQEGSPNLVPTVMAGLESIVAPYRRRTKDDWVNSHLTTLVGALYHLVSESARLAPGEDMTPETSQARYKSLRKEMLAALRRARDEVQVPASARGKQDRVAEEEEIIFWDGWQDRIKPIDLDEEMTEVARRGWLNSDWYRSIEHLRDKAAEGEDGAEDTLGEDSAATAAAVQITKADTMLQDKFDYLSERRRADYRQWKAWILRSIELREPSADQGAPGRDSSG